MSTVYNTFMASHHVPDSNITPQTINLTSALGKEFLRILYDAINKLNEQIYLRSLPKGIEIITLACNRMLNIV